MLKDIAVDSTKKRLLTQYDFADVNQEQQKRIKRENSFETFVLGSRNYEVTTLRHAKNAYARAKRICLGTDFVATDRFTVTFNNRRYLLRFSKEKKEGNVELMLWLYWENFVQEEEWRFILRNVAEWVEEDKLFFLSLPSVHSLIFQTFAFTEPEQLMKGWTLMVRGALSFFRWHVAGTLAVFLQVNVFDSDEKFQTFRLGLPSSSSPPPPVYHTMVHIQKPEQWGDLHTHLSSEKVQLRLCSRYAEVLEWDPEMCSVQDLMRPSSKAAFGCAPKHSNRPLYEAMNSYIANVDAFVNFSGKISERFYWMADFSYTHHTCIHLFADVVITSDNAPLM